MNYQTLLKKIAKEYNTTAEEVDREMRLAIKAAGLTTPPALFIRQASAQVKDKMKKQ